VSGFADNYQVEFVTVL